MKLSEWPLSEGNFRLITGHNGESEWYFCPFDGSEWILVSEDPAERISALIETLRLEMSLRATES